MDLIKNFNDLLDNIETLENYLNSENKEEKDFAHAIISGGDLTFLVYKFEGKNHYVPASFCSYKDNNLKRSKELEGSDDSQVQKALSKVLSGKARSLAKKEKEYLAYCKDLKLEPTDKERLYWRVGTGGDPFMDVAKQLKS